MKTTHFYELDHFDTILKMSINIPAWKSLQNKMQESLENPLFKKAEKNDIPTKEILAYFLWGIFILMVNFNFSGVPNTNPTIINFFLVLMGSISLAYSIVGFGFNVYVFVPIYLLMGTIDSVKYYEVSLNSEESQYLELFQKCTRIYQNTLHDFFQIIQTPSACKKFIHLLPHQESESFPQMVKLVFKDDFEQLYTIRSAHAKIKEYQTLLLDLIENEDESAKELVLSLTDQLKGRAQNHEEFSKLDTLLNHLILQKIEFPTISISQELKRLS